MSFVVAGQKVIIFLLRTTTTRIEKCVCVLAMAWDTDQDGLDDDDSVLAPANILIFPSRRRAQFLFVCPTFCLISVECLSVKVI